ncbi:hypothetical protein SH528x_003420 [Novipirellula sp. SH528]|uniref:hypothetical protein n=1 Tax=Novipirellula sp. SH528 TaxID=3454466 RepID=UPI003FA0E862
MLLLVALFAIAFLGFRRWFDQRPIQWVAYSTQSFAAPFDHDTPVIVFVGAGWDVNSLVVKQHSFEDQKLKRVIRERSFTLFYADLTSSSPEVLGFLRRIGRNTTPTIAVYSGGISGTPVVLDGMVSADQVINAIASQSKPTPSNDGG